MGDNVKKVMVPTDFSDCSREAEEYAGDLAKRLGASVFLLHVVEPPVYGLDFTLMHPGILPVARQKLIEMMQQSINRVKEKGIEAEGYFVVGVPFVEIIKAAQKHGMDLIVMGTHGRTGLAHVLLGSTAERVIQRAPCPVLAIKATGPSHISTEEKVTLETSGPLTEKESTERREVTYFAIFVPSPRRM